MDSGHFHRLTQQNLMQQSVGMSLLGRKLLAVGENKRSGLILCKNYHAEFAGPGAAIAVPNEQLYTSVIAIGSPDLVEVVTHEDRQKAYGRRIQWIRWLNRIVSHPDPAQRVEKLFVGFEEFFGHEVLANLPDSVLALLAGVLPHKVAQARSQDSRYSLTPDSPTAAPSTLVTFISQDWQVIQPPSLSKPISTLYPAAATAIDLPYSA